MPCTMSRKHSCLLQLGSYSLSQEFGDTAVKNSKRREENTSCLEIRQVFKINLFGKTYLDEKMKESGKTYYSNCPSITDQLHDSAFLVHWGTITNISGVPIYDVTSRESCLNNLSYIFGLFKVWLIIFCTVGHHCSNVTMFPDIWVITLVSAM